MCNHHQPQGTVELLNDDDDDNFYPATFFFFAGNKIQFPMSSCGIRQLLYIILFILKSRGKYLVFAGINNGFCNGRAVKGIT